MGGGGGGVSVLASWHAFVFSPVDTRLQRNGAQDKRRGELRKGWAWRLIYFVGADVRTPRHVQKYLEDRGT